ncbi:MAG: hypothetical protein KKD86_03595 [Bacteroidetes bacterium]|nr:hypothetical protein [Bacteroidota bacterium]MBU1677929.1 hypothetical protein [Bacteroidota bacterium]
MASEEYKFYEIIFCSINEEDFSVLFSETDSRPNAPVNALVSALILMNKYSWSYEELFKNINFNLPAASRFTDQNSIEIKIT